MGVAVNVTTVPGQMLFSDATMLTDEVMLGLTIIVMLLLVAFAGATQAALPVITQVTLSPLTRVLLLKLALFAPALLPFTSH